MSNMLQPNTIIITPNNRLSKQLLEDAYRNQGSEVCEKPLCFPYQTFLTHLFQRVRHNQIRHPMRLSALQERYLWQQVLEPHNASALFSDLQEAWTRCHLWRLDLLHPSFNDTPATQFFQQCALEMSKQLRLHDAITDAESVTYLLQHLDGIPLPDQIIWVAFDDFTPQQKALQAALKIRGCQQTYDNPTTNIGNTACYPAKDQQDEMLQMINWVNTRLAANDSCIGIVVPNLHTDATKIQRLFKRHLPAQPINISLGKALQANPLVAHALCWLRLNTQIVTHEQLSLLLNSPYIGGSYQEFTQRALFMQNKDVIQERALNYQWLLQKLQKKTPILYNLLNSLTSYPTKASAMDWVEHFKSRLQLIGFPGDYSQHSETYQCFQRFMALFDEFAQLNAITTTLDAATALNTLQTLTEQTIFQAKATTSAVHVLGLLEASGCRFDSIWICGLTDNCLPQKTHLSPFIPVHLQREYCMPHALPERELYLAQQTLQRFEQCSHNTVFSYPRFIGDHPQLPSPLIVNKQLFIHHALGLQTKYTNALIAYPSEDHVAFQNHDNIVVSGGTALLAHQAECPFRAFAKHRLHANRSPEPIDGLSLGERGQLIHKVMENIWQTLTTKAQLLEYSDSDLTAIISPIIHNTIQSFAKHRPCLLSPLMQTVEHARLLNLAKTCLELEKQRPAFTIEALEQPFTIVLADLTLTVRIDRLDRLDSNKKWIIDYKTSLPNRQRWYDERLEEPQLPVYALLDTDINAVLFIQLKTGDVTWQGLSEDEHPGITTANKNMTWETQRQTWHAQLTQLAAEFKAGLCQPKPNRPIICATCEFQALCRIETVI